MSSDIEIIPVTNIFSKNNYIIPIYQRNYAWNEKQIEQLIDDIDGSIEEFQIAQYFLGNLIVNQTDNNLYQVIDGQQRLTTLYLLEKYLGITFVNDALRFEARDKSNRTLAFINDNKKYELAEDLSSIEIMKGFKIIDNYFKTKQITKNNFTKKLNQVFLVRVQVPKDIDLNHYFEIMNTRGEQLELHEIAKSKIMDKLENSHDKSIAAVIWEKCSNMDSYLQMEFDINERRGIFTDDWKGLSKNIDCFESLKPHISENYHSDDRKTLLEILRDNKENKNNPIQNDNENERFESIISFPNFLLQVNAVLKNLDEDQTTLDDKHFLMNLSWAWSSSDNAKHFLFNILRCRVLFDKYIVKREFARDYKEAGKWSLQCLMKYFDSKNNDKPNYLGTFGDENFINKKIRVLQSCLRITYTSPKTMHWVSLVLSSLLKNEEADVLGLLEQYCKKKVITSDYKNASGFGIERIVFSYLDYLLYRDGYSYKQQDIIAPLQDDWQFQFRSSIEHFQPQNPVDGTTWENTDLNNFGNLALITVSGNSKFSNLPPHGKISSYPSIFEQSLKLKIMRALTISDDGIWTEEKSTEHKIDMLTILGK